ncbi:hypothetical protein [Marinicella rhabdoformis]|uniref:hypothetical protein n=1 Tax=Marinicella rhabdoformis TaxID=2580566 RepID=UPI0012AECFE5|nr:hypothetical protein [Marinicella rhabdoformis]
MKKIKKTFFYLFGFAFLLFAFTVIINLSVFDEELLPEVQAIKDIKAQPYGEDNAYPAIIAINGASGPSLLQATKTIRDHLNQQITTTGIDYLSDADYKNLIGKGHDDSWINTYHSCRSRTDDGCMNALVNDLLINPITDQRLLSQLQRYQSLLGFNDFSDARQMSFDSPLIAYGPTLNLQKLFLTDAYINLTSDEYLTQWHNDMVFWRMILNKSHLLISKMIAIAAVYTDIDSLSTAIKHGALSQQQLKQLQSSIKTLSPADINMGTTFEYEFKYGMSFIDVAFESEEYDSLLDALYNMFYQQHATHNISYSKGTKKYKEVSNLDSRSFFLYANSHQPEIDFSSPFTWSPTTLYNPMGKLLISYALPAYNDYIGRGHDLNGMFYLLKLQIEIALNPDKSVEQVIAHSQYTNPYTLEPMHYNKDSHSIYIDCMGKHSVCELSL